MNALTPIVFRPVTEISDPLPLSIGLSGGSGTGKTYTALSMARGIAREMTGNAAASIGYVDTENRRALHYKTQFPEMLHFDMQAVDEQGNMIGFPPERWIEVIDAAEAARVDVLVIDSFSHAWEGVNGVLDLQSQELDRLAGNDQGKRMKQGQLAWAAVKPRYRRLIDRIVRAKVPVIICTRAKPVMQTGFGSNAKNARATKTRRQDVPWDPASDGDLMFEMTTMVILDPTAPGHPIHQIKVADQFKNLLDVRRPMNAETGQKMAAWAKGDGEGAQQKVVLDAARSEARKGSASFKMWWNTDDAKANRATMRPILAELAQIAEIADQDAADHEDDDPLARFNASDPDDNSQGHAALEEAQDVDAESGSDDGPEEDQIHRNFVDQIKNDLLDASADEVVEMYGPNIEQIKDKSPKLHQELMDAIKAKRDEEAQSG